MKIITKRDQIKSVLQRWEEQYSEAEYKLWPETRKIYAKLKTLDFDVATEEDIAAIIGNDTWTRLDCGECGKSVEAVVHMGEEEDYGSLTIFLCESCIGQAYEAFMASKNRTE